MQNPLRLPEMRYFLYTMVVLATLFLLFCPHSAYADTSRLITNDTVIELTPLETVLQGESYVVRTANNLHRVILLPSGEDNVIGVTTAAVCDVENVVTVRLYSLTGAGELVTCN